MSATVAYWITTGVMASGETEFLRAHAVSVETRGDELLMSWKLQRAKDLKYESASDERLRGLQLYRVAVRQPIEPARTLREQSLEDGEVLVLLSDYSADHLPALSAQAFPPKLNLSLAAPNTKITWTEIHVRDRHKPDQIDVPDQPPPPQISVIVNIAPGATFSGPLAVGNKVSQTYQTAKGASDEGLRTQLEQLTKDVAKLIEKTEKDDKKNELAEDLKIFVQQATQETPSKKLLDVTAKGILEAANTMAEISGPIVKAVAAVLGLLA